MAKYGINYWKTKNIEILDYAPENWLPVKNATTAPNGYDWYYNGKSFFKGERKHCLVKNKNFK
jgi:hypothetical protein